MDHEVSSMVSRETHNSIVRAPLKPPQDVPTGLDTNFSSSPTSSAFRIIPRSLRTEAVLATACRSSALVSNYPCALVAEYRRENEIGAQHLWYILSRKNLPFLSRKKGILDVPVLRILRSSSPRIVRDCHGRGFGFTGEMLDLLDRDTRGRAWTCPPAHPFGLTVSYVQERLIQAMHRPN